MKKEKAEKMLLDNPKLAEYSARISTIRDTLCGGDNKLFAKKLGVSTAYSSALCNEKQPITQKTLEKILSIFPEVSTHWLYHGEGSMTASGQTVNQQNNVHGDNNINSGDIINTLVATNAKLTDTLQRQTDSIQQQTDYIGRLIAMLEAQHVM